MCDEVFRDFKLQNTNIIYVAVAMMLLCLSLTSCGYSFEELTEMSQYKAQGEINALNYIKEKYGFDATVVDVVCEKTDGGGDFSPPLSGNVFVTLKQDEKTFLVLIDGDEVTSTGFDNYQYEEIKSALEEKLFTITDLPAEELFIFYGRCKTYNAIELNRNGLITTYFDGSNLAEVLTDQFNYPAATVSYINQDIEYIDIKAVKEQTGMEHFLFVDYDSKEHYSTIEQPYYNSGATPLNLNIEHNMPYVNEYLMTDSKENIYVNCEKTIVNDVLVVTKYVGEQVTLEKANEEIKVYDPLNRNYKQEFDTYVLNTDSERVYVYVPLDKLHTQDLNSSLVELIAADGSSNLHATNILTDDEKYIGAIIYTKDYDDIKFSVFTKQD